MTPGVPPTDAAVAPSYGGVALLPALLDVGALASLLGMSPAAVRGLLRRRQLPAARIGKRWIVRGAAVLDYLRKAERRGAVGV